MAKKLKLILLVLVSFLLLLSFRYLKSTKISAVDASDTSAKTFNDIPTSDDLYQEQEETAGALPNTTPGHLQNLKSDPLGDSPGTAKGDSTGEIPETSNSHPKLSQWDYHFKEDFCDPPENEQNEYFYFTHDKKQSWSSFDPALISQKQLEWKEFIESAPLPPYSPKTRGIVYTASPHHLKLLQISIRFLRNNGCKLPIEVWHNDELIDVHERVLDRLGNVIVRNIIDYADKLPIVNGRLYVMKGAALMYTPFQEVLYLDIDNMAMQDPTFLFDTPAYKETGTLFWKDLWKERIDNPIWKILGIECRDEYQQESGQLVINKGKAGVLKALRLAFYMQEHGDFYYKYLQGDKDTFRLAWRALGASYHMVRPYMGLMGTLKANGGFCGSTMVQFAPYWTDSEYGQPPLGYSDPKEPSILFLHKNFFKGEAEIKLDKFMRPNPAQVSLGKGDFAFFDGVACTTLKDYKHHGSVLSPVLKDTRDYIVGVEEKYREYSLM